MYPSFHIRSEDHPNTNLLQHFSAAVAYIDAALTQGGGVFVHCAMGKSRSATLVCAYLIWKDGLSPTAALEQVCEGRPVCDPNPGFKEQLEVWWEMYGVDGGEEDKKKKVYDAWEKTRFTGEVWEWEARMKQRREQEQEQGQERSGKSKL
jgi:dual specificity phosphatase 12